MSGYDYGRAFEGVGKFLVFSVFVLIPLSVWKVIDILAWLYRHVEIGLK